jgi:hypothetical protein
MCWRGFGFVHRSRTVFCRAVPNPNLTIRNCFIAVQVQLTQVLRQNDGPFVRVLNLIRSVRVAPPAPKLKAN